MFYVFFSPSCQQLCFLQIFDAMSVTAIRLKQERFLSASHFAVVGASQDLSKRASKVLGWYRDKHMNVTLVHPREKQLYGVDTVPSLYSLPSPTTTAISISTVPFITLSLLKQARSMSVFSIWIQPGACDFSVIRYIEENDLYEKVIWGGPCILKEGDEIVRDKWFRETHGQL
ncbi:CoA binding domain-containing protein [Collybia nuda]|uniref:CoA binding domain-containing protein n=1 Tax=Collybia nuda TaxID=64659 RepID=A0A9P5Y548_9AGAR|nr:CoA binding domain-containing protein [Collybia nuda]